MSADRRRTVPLSPGGVMVALTVGAISLLTGWRWAVLLIVFFIAATAVSRFRADLKTRRAAGLLDKTGPRDAYQVLANGAAFAVTLLMFMFTGNQTWAAFAAGALAGASSDTWATELGMLSRHAPRSVVTGRTVQPGQSGGVTAGGTLAGIAGASIVAVTAWALGLRLPLLVITIGGLAGMLIDSLLGASLQERRYCATCDRLTERRVHVCGTATQRAGGIPGLTNDAVNGLATVAAGAVSALLWVTLS